MPCVGDTMAAFKRELGLKGVKPERDPDLQKAMRLSLMSSVKAERSAVKAEPRVGVKAEQRVGVKAEQTVRVKAERTAMPSILRGSSSGSEQKLPPLSVKIEELRRLGKAKIKAELLRGEPQEQASGSIAKLVARGLQMREKDNKVKKEKGLPGKKRFGVKLLTVKKERRRNMDGSLRKKARITAKGRKSRREVMSREVALSDELGEVLGASALSRPEAVSRLWAYCRENNMLNPENRREIHFDTKMEKLLGTKSATMPQLSSLMMGHFDYTVPVVNGVKQEPGAQMKMEAKREQHMKVEAKKEQHMTVKNETTGRPKKEHEISVKHETKQEPGAKRLKTEPGASLQGTAKTCVEEALAGTAVQISSFDRTSAVVGCVAPPGHFQLEALATPTSGPAAGNPALRALCTVEFREGRNGDLEPRAEARLKGLDPGLAYRVTVQICGGGGCSHEATLAQRKWPAKWTAREVEAWCQAQHVPELVRMAQDYAIDGTTLLSMGEEDLKASGLAAPFLLRRTLSSLAALRAGGS